MYRIYMRHEAMCPLSPRTPRTTPAEPAATLFDDLEV
jgi:hypothetical protein